MTSLTAYGGLFNALISSICFLLIDLTAFSAASNSGPALANLVSTSSFFAPISTFYLANFSYVIFNYSYYVIYLPLESTIYFIFSSPYY